MTQNCEPAGNCTGNCAYCEDRGTPRRDGSMPMCTRVQSETVLRTAPGARLSGHSPAAWSPGALLARAFARHYRR